MEIEYIYSLLSTVSNTVESTTFYSELLDYFDENSIFSMKEASLDLPLTKFCRECFKIIHSANKELSNTEQTAYIEMLQQSMNESPTLEVFTEIANLHIDNALGHEDCLVQHKKFFPNDRDRFNVTFTSQGLMLFPIEFLAINKIRQLNNMSPLYFDHPFMLKETVDFMENINLRLVQDEVTDRINGLF